MFITRRFFFYNDFVLFFYKNIFFVKCFFTHRVYFFFLPRFYFFKVLNVFNKKKLSLFFFSKYFLFSFLAHLFFILKKINICFFFKCKVKGIGYRVKNVTKRLVRIFLGFTNYFYCHVPFNVLLKCRRRKLFFFSNDLLVLKNFFLNILKLYLKTPYELRGFFFPRQIILLKSGKKRF